MGIISKIKSVLGVADDGQERQRDRGRTARVDDEPETSSERAVKGVESDDEPSTGAAGETATPEPVETPTGAADADDGESAAGSVPSGATDEPVDSIKGIGAAYARRLSEAGIDSVADLAGADSEELADATGLGTGRVGKWIERAQARTE